MMNSTKILIPELDNAAIRCTSDGRFSVYDIISVIGQQKNPREVWKRLCKQYPEVVTSCDNLQFPGRGQRETPVTSREGWAYILGLLPGVMGHRYREAAADLVTRYLDADITLAADIVDRNENQEDLERMESRVRGKLTRRKFTATLKAHGVVGKGYGRCTNQTYLGLLGRTAKKLKKEKGLSSKASLRDNLSRGELNALSFTEDLSGKKIDQKNDQGSAQCANTCRDVARRVSAFATDLLSA